MTDSSNRRARAEVAAATCLLGAHPPLIDAAALHVLRAHHELAESSQSFDAFVDAIREDTDSPLHPLIGEEVEEDAVTAALAEIDISLRKAAGEPTTLRGVLEVALRRHWRLAAGGVVALAIVAFIRTRVERKSAWDVSYYPSVDLTGAPAKTTVGKLDEWWRSAGPPLLARNDYFSARYESCLVLNLESTVTFELASDDGSRLFVDDQLVIDAWFVHSALVQRAQRTLQRGKHRLVIEYFEETGGASISFGVGIGSRPPSTTSKNIQRCTDGG